MVGRMVKEVLAGVHDSTDPGAPAGSSAVISVPGIKLKSEFGDRDNLRKRRHDDQNESDGSEVNAKVRKPKSEGTGGILVVDITADECNTGHPASSAIKHLSKQDLETLVLEQMVVALRDRSYIGSLEKRFQASENQLERNRLKVVAMQKQVDDLTTVVRRFVNLAKNRKDLIPPLKVTRTIGLQVDAFKRPAPVGVKAAPSSSSTPSSATRTPAEP